MPIVRLPETTHTLYAELLEQAIHAAAREAAVGVPRGSFVRKKIKGRTYWYLQRMEGGRKVQQYLGPESESLRAWIEAAREARQALGEDEAGRARLCAMLQAGGAYRESPAVVRLLELLSDAGVFRLGGVLVGTQAFAAYGNMLGVQVDRQALRTQDVDVAQEPSIGVALAAEDAAGDVGRALKESDLNVQEIPRLDSRQVSTSYSIRGRELRIDFLTPMYGRESTRPVPLPALRVAAQPVRFLDYLIDGSQQAVVMSDRGVLVNVPEPARFALHKLWTSQKRPAAEHAKARKDVLQATQVIEVLLADRPGDLVAAWEVLLETRSPQRRVRTAIERLEPRLRLELARVLGDRDLAESIQA